MAAEWSNMKCFAGKIELPGQAVAPSPSPSARWVTWCSWYQIDVRGAMPMRLAALLSLALLIPGAVYAHDSHKARASDKSQEVATAKAMRRVPEGATVTDTFCKEVNYVFQTRFRCTVTYSD